MNTSELTKFKETELKTLGKKYPSRNDCSNHETKHAELCQGCIRIKVLDEDEFNEIISTLIDQTVEKVEGLMKEGREATHEDILKSNLQKIGKMMDERIEVLKKIDPMHWWELSLKDEYYTHLCKTYAELKISYLELSPTVGKAEKEEICEK